MNLITLTDIPFELDSDILLSHVHLDRNSDDANDVLAMAHDAFSIGRPKAMYQVAFVTHTGDKTVEIDGVEFTSRILRVNLDTVHRVFPYMATCGAELQQWSDQYDDMLQVYWADVIKEMALACATGAMQRDLQIRYLLGPVAMMNPGSLPDWPIKEQKPFFQLFGDAISNVGIELSSSYLMTPNKSVTGIHYSMVDSFESCQLCPREDCPGRRAPYDETQFERYGLKPQNND